MAGHPDFGKHIDPAIVIQSVLGTEPITSSIELQQVLRDVYETTYGIYNHVSNLKNPPAARRPLASVAFHKSEDYTTGSVMEETMRIFRDLPIKEITGFNYQEWMRQPPYVVETQIKLAKEKQDRESQAVAKADATLRNAHKEQLQQKALQIKQRPFPQPPGMK